MTELITSRRQPLALGAAALLMAATIFISLSGPVGAGALLEFTVAPASAEVGDTVTVSSDVACPPRDDPYESVEVRVLDADDNEVFSTTGVVGTDMHWSVDIDTTGLDEGTYTVGAACMTPQGPNNYQSETLTLTAPVVETTTTSEATTTTAPVTSTTEAPAPVTPPPATAVAGSPNYTG